MFSWCTEHVREAKIQIQPVHSRSLIRTLNGRSLDSQWHKVSSCGQRRYWQDCAKLHTDLNRCCAHITNKTGFFDVVDQLILTFSSFHITIINMRLAKKKKKKKKKKWAVFQLYMSQRMTKPTIRLVRPAKTQISLRIRVVWSESLLSACAYFSFRFLGPFKNISLISRRSFIKVDENRRTRGKTTWPSVSRTWLSHIWPERGSNHFDEKPNGLRVNSPIH